MAAPTRLLFSTCRVSSRIIGANKQKNAFYKHNIIGRGMCYAKREVDVSTPKPIFLFDTHAVVKQFENSGYTTEQAESLTNILVSVLSSQVEFQAKNLVSKQQQEIMLQQIMAHIAAIKKDMIILEKSEFSALKHEYEKQSIELRQLKQTMNDELQKVKGGVSLDMSLERSRAKEDHADNRRALAEIGNKIEIQETDSEKKLSALDNKIDKEMANLLATFERYRNDVLKYSAGAVMTCLTICLGFYRLWS